MELNTEYQDTVICPWCGYRVVEGDLFEFDDGEQECIECGKLMELSISYPAALYSTKKKK